MNVYTTEIKPFMNLLLASPAFDGAAFIGGELVTVCRVTFSGGSAKWGDMREKIKFLISGGKTPSSLKVSLSFSPEQAGLPADSVSCVNSLSLNIYYENGALLISTAVNYSAFTLDKTSEDLWAKSVQKSFAAHGLELKNQG